MKHSPMSYLRTWLHTLVLAVTMPLFAVVVLASGPFVSRRTSYAQCAAWLRVAGWATRHILGIEPRVQGLQHLPKDPLQGAVLLCKHQSVWETFFLPIALPRPLAFVFKKELLSIPLFGWAMGLMDMIHIDRGNRAEAFKRVVSQGQRLLSEGRWIIMFPEGTRVSRGEVGRYKAGGVRLAMQTGAPIIPIAVTSGRVWPRKAFIKTPGVVDVSIGPSIPTTGRTEADLLAQVEQWIEGEMRRLDPLAYADASGQQPNALNVSQDADVTPSSASAQS